MGFVLFPFGNQFTACLLLLLLIASFGFVSIIGCLSTIIRVLIKDGRVLLLFCLLQRLLASIPQLSDYRGEKIPSNFIEYPLAIASPGRNSHKSHQRSAKISIGIILRTNRRTDYLNTVGENIATS